MSVDMVDHDTDTGRTLIPGEPTGSNLTYINEAGVSEDVMEGLKGNRDIANAIEQWSQSLNAAAQSTVPSINMFTRGRQSGHKGIFQQIAQCAWAVESDDILSTLADVSEALTFQKVRFELFDSKQQQVWNKWAKQVDLDTILRQATRELFKVSQVYMGMWWEKVVVEVYEDKVKSTLDELDKDARRASAERENQELPDEEKKGPGRGRYVRPTKFPLEMPSAMTIFDPTKVVPVGMLMFGRERFAYVATESEDLGFHAAMGGAVADGTVLQLIERKYTPTTSEAKELNALGIDSSRLWLMRKGSVFRHTLTRASYERFAPVRLRSILPILEMKAHLRSSDRASLVGNTNFIIVVTKGTDKLPAKQAEIENLQEQVKVIARLPVLVGDHRLNVEIVSPALDNTLIESRWEVLDSRLVFKALQTFQPTIQGGSGGGTGVSEMSRVVARGLESRRHMLVRALERHVFDEVMERNEGYLDESPSLEFSPRRISLDFSKEIIASVLKLRDRGDISRETTLEELDYDQDVEVLRRAREKVQYDDVFHSQTPHSSPTANPYGAEAPGSNVGPNGQPRTEGGRPSGVLEDEPREAKV